MSSSSSNSLTYDKKQRWIIPTSFYLQVSVTAVTVWTGEHTRWKAFESCGCVYHDDGKSHGCHVGRNTDIPTHDPTILMVPLHHRFAALYLELTCVFRVAQIIHNLPHHLNPCVQHAWFAYEKAIVYPIGGADASIFFPITSDVDYSFSSASLSGPRKADPSFVVQPLLRTVVFSVCENDQL